MKTQYHPDQEITRLIGYFDQKEVLRGELAENVKINYKMPDDSSYLDIFF